METTLKGSPSFAYLDVGLEPGESLIAETDAMTTMAGDLDMKAKLNGGLFSGLAKAILGGESLFINHFTNNTAGVRQMTLAQGLPGDSIAYDLAQGPICLQPGAFIAASEGAELGTRWAGFASGISREGFSQPSHKT
ncbi:MAG: TIGR00266 family protein [Opitutales bacterium]|nr:TIGR00266 family protein [Opitutales bacterium]NRA28321.1 TIGR00266 family protein [Opitutales bacterium]